MTLVLDASVALTWCFEDERRAETDALGRRVLDEGANVTGLFHVELANVLLVAERKGRITTAEAEARLDRIALMPLTVDGETQMMAWSATLQLARAERLTVYDATYLELALRLGADLATLDHDLAAAACRRGLTVIP